MDFRKYQRKIICLLAIVALGMLTMPWLLLVPDSGLDVSWRIGLYMAVMKHFQFGRDIIFTFGPLGFLYSPMCVDFRLWALSSLFNFIFHFLFLASLAMLLIRSSFTWRRYVYMGGALFLTEPWTYIEFKTSITIIIILYFLLTGDINKKYRPYLLICSSFFLALISLIKFSAALISIGIIFFSSVIMASQRQFKWQFYILIFYGVSFLSLWVFSGQKVSNLTSYFFNSSEISIGYNSAMSIAGPAWELCTGIFIITIIVFILIYAVKWGKQNVFIFIMLSWSLIFMNFKHGFVRHDGHAYIFFSNMLLFLSILYISNKENLGNIFRPLILLISLMLAAIICAKSPPTIKPYLTGKTSMMKSFISYIVDPKKFTESSKDKIRKKNPLNDFSLGLLRDKSVDIFPWEISLAYAYDLKWSPRPIFQSYSAYTSRLDLINARHFQDKKSPNSIIYAYNSIDGRYPIFDEPATFKEVLCNYHASYRDGEFIILKKNKNGHCLTERILSTYVTNIGETISVPIYYGGFVFAKITLEYNLIGKIVSFFYKPSQAYIKFINSNGIISNKFRFIPNVAKNGIFLSQYINNIDDLYSLFSGSIDIDNRIREIIIDADRKWHYKNKINVEFISMPAEVTENNKKSRIPPLKSFN